MTQPPPIATVCVAFSSPSHVSRALERDVRPLLERARREGLEPNVVLVGGSCIGSFQHTEELKSLTTVLDTMETEGIQHELVVSFDDLVMLRFFPSIGIGELCRSEDATLEELVEVIRRVPAIKNIESVSDVVYSEHVQECEATARYLQALVKSEPDVDLKPLFALALYAKAVSLGWKTAKVRVDRIESILSSIPKSDALGLTQIIPVNGAAPSILTFLSCYMVDEDAHPGEIRVPEAATAATQALERVFTHAERVHAVLKRSKLATMVHSYAPLVDAGPKQAFIKLIYGRQIEMVTASSSSSTTTTGFDLKTKSSKNWVDDLNNDLMSVLEALEQPSSGDDARAFKSVVKAVAPKLAAMTTVSSPLFTIDAAALAASMADILLANKKFGILTHTKTHAAHVSAQLEISECAMDVAASVLHLGKKEGGEPTIASIFPVRVDDEALPVLAKVDVFADANTLKEMDDLDAVTAHQKLQDAVKSLDKPSSPIGMLIGTVTSKFEFEGSEMRAIVWRRRGGEEIRVSLHDAVLLKVLFADYAFGSLDGQSVGMNKVSNLYEITSTTRLKLNTISAASSVFRFSKSGETATIELVLTETSSDRLAGVQVQWARRGDEWLLVHNNEQNERLVV